MLGRTSPRARRVNRRVALEPALTDEKRVNAVGE
jgi:hypothetical protein